MRVTYDGEGAVVDTLVILVGLPPLWVVTTTLLH